MNDKQETSQASNPAPTTLTDEHLERVAGGIVVDPKTGDKVAVIGSGPVPKARTNAGVELVGVDFRPT